MSAACQADPELLQIVAQDAKDGAAIQEREILGAGVDGLHLDAGVGLGIDQVEADGFRFSGGMATTWWLTRALPSDVELICDADQLEHQFSRAGLCGGLGVGISHLIGDGDAVGAVGD